MEEHSYTQEGEENSELPITVLCVADINTDPLELEMESTDSKKWTYKSTKILIANYKRFKPLVEQGKFKNLRRMHEKIQTSLEQHGYSFTTAQIENKWKSLQRSYRNARVNTLNKNGRGRRFCAFHSELSQIIEPTYSSKHTSILDAKVEPGKPTVAPVEVQFCNNEEFNIDRDKPECPTTSAPNILSKNNNPDYLKRLIAAVEQQNEILKTSERNKYQQRNQMIEAIKEKNEILKQILQKM